MSLRKIAKELEISHSYLSDIINGKNWRRIDNMNTINEITNEITNELAKKQANEIDKTIIEFLKQQGYKNITINSLNTLIKKWRVEGKQLRYELFYKSLEQTAFSIRQEYIIITFFDLIPSTITRNDIYEMYNLKTKGYMLGE